MIKKRRKKIGFFVSINVYNNQVLKIIFFIFIFVFLLSSSTLAETIWRIGIDNGDADEYKHPQLDPNLNKEIVNYRVPQDWNTRGIDGWKSFPCKLWPLEVQFYPKEIHITYDYTKEYRDVILRIKAKSENNSKQKLIVNKQGDLSDQNNGFQLPEDYYKLFEFPLGNIKKGLQKENDIIIKNQSVSDNNYSIYFDYLELDDQDQDGDGSLDYEEIEGDIDGDGHGNIEDRDTVSLIIQGLDESIKKRITLDIEEGLDSKTYFTQIAFMDTNFPSFPPGIPGDLFFPFCFFKADIQIPADDDRILIQILYPEDETIYPEAQFYINKDYGDWERVSVEIIDVNILVVSIDGDNSGNNNEGYSQEEGKMTIIGGLAYPQGVGIDLDESRCFINSLIL